VPERQAPAATGRGPVPPTPPTPQGGPEPEKAAAAGRSGHRRLSWLREAWDSTIGKKFLVAVTGVILVLYVVLHALGNLKAFQGAGEGDPAIDAYAGWLRDIGEPALPHEAALWIVRVILVAALVIHIILVVQLYLRNRDARPATHRPAPRIRRSLSARTMLISGAALFAFIVFHILQFTTRTIQVTPVEAGTVYTNVYTAFQEWYLVLIYVGAVILLGLHLHHALWSVTQTAGWDKPNRNPTFRRAAAVVSIGVAVAFAAVPLAAWTDVLPEPEEETQVVSVNGSP
jgi:succinate dehydrogenase / fumarate reductase, cytochrome b subunit